MSLYLPEQKLGSHSTESASSNKFILKGRQTGSMHRGHTWVFRAESYDTMLAWYDDIKAMTERSPEERSNFLRGHGRSISRSSQRSSMSSDGGVDDDEDPPFASTAVPTTARPKQDVLQRRPSGGRFPSDLQVNAERGLQVPRSPLSVSSGYSEDANGHAAAAAALPGAYGQQSYGAQSPSSWTGTGTGRGEQNGTYPLPIHPESNYGAPRTTDGRNMEETAVVVDGSQGYPASTGLGRTRSPESGRELRQGLGENAAMEAAGMNGGGAAYRDQKPTRPAGGAMRNDSIPTISHLHIPGEYPRGPSTS